MGSGVESNGVRARLSLRLGIGGADVLPSSWGCRGGGGGNVLGLASFFSSFSFSGVSERLDGFLALSLSPTFSLQLAPIALAKPHKPFFLGDTEDFSVPDVPVAWVCDMEALDDCPLFGPAMLEISSSQIFSTTPVRTKAHNEHVERRRARHQPLVQRGYIVLLD
jgi:hypothetical protein